MKNHSVKNGAVWNDKMTIKQIFVHKNEESGRPEMAGILLETGEFVPADCAHITVGYKGYFEYENTKQTPIRN